MKVEVKLAKVFEGFDISWDHKIDIYINFPIWRGMVFCGHQGDSACMQLPHLPFTRMFQ